MKRNCQKGKSCGSSCISNLKKCRVDAQEEMSKGLSSLVKKIINPEERKGRRERTIGEIGGITYNSMFEAIMSMMVKKLREDPDDNTLSKYLALRYLRRKEVRESLRRKKTDNELLRNSPSYNSTPGKRTPIPVLDKAKEMERLNSEIARLNDKLSRTPSTSAEWNKINQERIQLEENRRIATQYGQYHSPPLRNIYESQGYNSKPELVARRSDLADRQDILRHSDGRPLILYRGIKSESSSEQFKGGDLHFPGKGVYGDGSYAASSPFSPSATVKHDRWAKDTAIEYAGGGAAKNLNRRVTAFALRSDAVVVRNNSEEDFNKWYQKVIKEAMDKTGYKFSDPGHAAAALGIHAYNIPQNGQDFWVILNRGAIIGAVDSQVEE